MEKFNPNEICVPNGNFFGFPYTPEVSKIILLPMPWDVTTSYNDGSSRGPQAMLDASVQLDFFDFDIENAWEVGIATLPVNKEIAKINKAMRTVAKKVINALESGESIENKDLQRVNEASEMMNDYVMQQSLKWIKKDKIVAIVGGDHSSPFGLIKALAKKHDGFGILHIDAHADLRIAYEGFEYSHASIMYNASIVKNVEKIVQVGIRDVCQNEVDYVKSNSRKIRQFPDTLLKEKKFTGIAWHDQCVEIIRALPEKVYISFDIDGLTPDNCPNTGTPVPGGLTYEEAVYLLKLLWMSGKEIIGFDLCEVAPGNNEWDANVGARILYKLCTFAGTKR